MAFTTFLQGATISADEMNDNFYHVGQENFLPMGGSSLDTTNGVYDLGSTTAKWNNVYTNEVNATNLNVVNVWRLVASQDFTATNSRYEVTGLNGDVDEIYRIVIHQVDYTNSSIGLTLNGDSGTNYGFIGIASAASVPAYEGTSSQTSMQISFTNNLTTTANCSYSESYLYALAGAARSILKNEMRYANKYIYSTIYRVLAWFNAIDTITSMAFEGRLNSGTSIEIWKCGGNQ